MKKYISIFAFTIVTFLTALVSVDAREVKLENLNDILSSDVNSAYVIGNYLFTSKHKLTLEDIMLASRSIDVQDKNGKTNTDPVYNEMSIIGIRKSYLDDDDMVGSWVYDSNLSGTTKIDNTALDIKYVDYKFVSEETKINKENIITDSFSENFLKEFQKLGFTQNDDTLEFSYDEKTKTLNVSGIAKMNNEVGTKYGDASLKYFLGLAVEVPNATDKTVATVKSWQRKTETNISFDVTESGKKGFALFLALSPDADSKEAVIKIDLDGFDSEGYDTTTIKVNWENVEFEGSSKLSIDLDVDSNDIEAVKEKLGYEKTAEDTYKLSFDEASKTYTLSGDVVYQKGPISHFADTDPKGYYVLLKISDPNFKAGKTVVTVPCKSCTSSENKKNLTVDEDGYILLLMALDSQNSSDTFDITVDLDGNESLYIPTTYTLKYDTDLVFKERTSFTMSVDQTGVNGDYGYSANPSSIVLTDGALSGTVKLTKNVTNTSLGADDKLTNYYVPIKLNITNDSNATIKVNGKVVTDKTILLPVSKTNRLTETFTIEVDSDGENEKYLPSKKELTYKELEFQEESSYVTVSASVDEKYNFSANWDETVQKNVDIKNVDGTLNLSGDVKVQRVDDDKKSYVAFSVTIRSISDKTPTIELKPNEDNQGKLVEFKDSTIANARLTRVFLYELPSDLNKTATLTIDLDGDEDAYAPQNYTVNFSGITLISLYTIKFSDVEEYGNYSDVDVYANEIPNVKTPVTNNEYLVFDHWGKTEGGDTVDLTRELTEDVTVKPYFNIKLNDYMENYKTKFKASGITLDGSNGSYNFKVTTPEKELDSLNELKLTDTLTSILKDLKATSIEINGNSISDFNEVSNKISELISQYSTYDELVVNNFKFTIKVTGSEDYKINDEIEEYTFNFISDFRVAKNKSELTNALKSGVKTIYISKAVSEIDLESDGLDVTTEDVTIDGRNKTIKSTKKDYVINISSNSTIKNLTIDGNKTSEKGILVSSGNLTTDKLTVNNIKADSNGVAPAIEVSDSASADISNLIYDAESYDNPAVRAKSSASVTLNRSRYNKAAAKNYEEVTTYETLKNTSKEAAMYGDKKALKADYDYKHYYLNSNNETKWYELTFEGDFNVTRVLYKFYRYVEKDKLDWSTYTQTILPKDDDAINYLTKYDASNGYAYEVNNVCAPTLESSKCVVLNNLSELPEPTGDTIYSVKLQYKGLQSGVEEVEDVETLRQKVQDPNVRKIILKGNTEYDLGSTPLTIDRTLTINGTLTGQDLSRTSVIKGKIIVNANNVSLIQVAIKGKAEGTNGDENIITVNNPGFYLYQSDISVDKDSKFKNVIYYNVASPKTTIYFTKFIAEEDTNMTSFIEFAKNLGAEDDGFMTELLGNTFYGGKNMKAFIKIDSLDNTTKPVDIIVKQSHFKIQNEESYAVEISKTPTGSQPINFYFASPSLFNSTVQKIKIKINVTDEMNDASSITFNKPDNFNNLEIHYFKNGEDAGTSNPEGSSKDAKIGNKTVD